MFYRCNAVAVRPFVDLVKTQIVSDYRVYSNPLSDIGAVYRDSAPALGNAEMHTDIKHCTAHRQKYDIR